MVNKYFAVAICLTLPVLAAAYAGSYKDATDTAYISKAVRQEEINFMIRHMPRSVLK